MRTKRVVRPAEGGNPNAQAFKQIEMSIKRAYELNSGLIDQLAISGDVRILKENRVWHIMSNKDLKSALNWGSFGSEDPAVLHQDVWEWVIDHWYSGALKRSVVAQMDNLTDKNKKAIKDKVETLYGG